MTFFENTELCDNVWYVVAKLGVLNLILIKLLRISGCNYSWVLRVQFVCRADGSPGHLQR